MEKLRKILENPNSQRLTVPGFIAIMWTFARNMIVYSKRNIFNKDVALQVIEKGKGTKNLQAIVKIAYSKSDAIICR